MFKYENHDIFDHDTSVFKFEFFFPKLSLYHGSNDVMYVIVTFFCIGSRYTLVRNQEYNIKINSKLTLFRSTENY